MRKYLFLLVILSATCHEGITQSQTRTANRFNWNGNPYMNLWQTEGAQYVSVNDNSFAYSKRLSAGRSFLGLVLQDFRFDLPANSTIDGITVLVRRFKKGKASIRDYFAWLYRSGSGFYNPSPYGVRWTDPRNYPDAEAEVSYYQTGSGNNGVGVGNEVYAWTPAMINDPDFGVRIDTYAPVGGSLTVYYDLVTITVEYSQPEPGTRKSPGITETKPMKEPIVYPNPFTTKSNIQFTASESGSAVVELYNITGTKIRTLFSANVVQGEVYNASFGDALLPSGVYVYTISNGKQKHTGKMIKVE
jgi:Secretion system C-terminal sorting domain